MRLSFGVLFLGLWLNARLAQNTSEIYPKPIISITPSGVLPLGTNITITCKSDNQVSNNFYFWRQGTCKQEYETTMKKENVYSIVNARQSDGQLYFCSYCSHEDNNIKCSGYSDEVNITLRDPNLLKPTIQGDPKNIYSGSKMTISCQGPENGLMYSLWKSDIMIGTMKAELDSKTVQFPLYNTKPQDSGNYSCHYQLNENPFVWSLQSEPTEIIVKSIDDVPGLRGFGTSLRDGGSLTLLVLLMIFPCIFFRTTTATRRQVSSQRMLQERRSRRALKVTFNSRVSIQRSIDTDNESMMN